MEKVKATTEETAQEIMEALGRIFWAVIVLFIRGVGVFIMWNLLMPFFSLPILTFWQAVGLVFLFKFLLGR
jgi:hypothetical protein